LAPLAISLADRATLVAEGVGAAAVAILLGGRLAPVGGATVALVSGGNVDSGLLARLLRRKETKEGRRVPLFMQVPDRPAGWPSYSTLSPALARAC